MLSSTARQALHILGWQLAGLILPVSAAAFIGGVSAARSVLAGGGIGLVATSYLMFVLIKHNLRPARPATVLSLFGNWFIKTGLVLGLLVIALRAHGLQPAAVMMGLAVSLVSYWLSVMRLQYPAQIRERDKTNE
jgi:F0F1-type ATP synthase assembly protein I